MVRKISSFVALTLFLSIYGAILNISQAQGPDIAGRWDLTVGTAPSSYPSWLEVTFKGGKLGGRFVGKVGSARLIKQIDYQGGNLTFSLPPQYENTKDNISFQGTFINNELRGTTQGEDGLLPWVGVRAPELPRPTDVKWGKPIPLFNGKDMKGWKLKNATAANGWKVVSGVMESHMPSSDIVSEGQFKDFKLHIEFNYIPKSNSGIYLRGRYEVQIQDDIGKPPESHFIGGLYGFIDPTVNAAKKAGAWQSYDITILGRWVTVVLNGRTVIDNKEIPGITGGALHSREAEPGPLMLQGDHGDISFRNIVLTPAED